MLSLHVVDGVIGEVEFNMMRKQYQHIGSNGFIVKAVAASSSNSNTSTDRLSDGSSHSQFTHVLLLLDDAAAKTQKRMKPNTTHNTPLVRMENTSYISDHISHTFVLPLFQLSVTVLNMLSSVRSV
jgi:hypothetical protein